MARAAQPSHEIDDKCYVSKLAFNSTMCTRESRAHVYSYLMRDIDHQNENYIFICILIIIIFIFNINAYIKINKKCLFEFDTHKLLNLIYHLYIITI